MRTTQVFKLGLLTAIIVYCTFHNRTLKKEEQYGSGSGLKEREKVGNSYAAAFLYSDGNIREKSFFGDKYSISETLSYLIQKWNAKLKLDKQFGVLPQETEEKLGNYCRSGSFKHLYFEKFGKMIRCQVRAVQGNDNYVIAETFDSALALALVVLDLSQETKKPAIELQSKTGCFPLEVDKSKN